MTPHRLDPSIFGINWRSWVALGLTVAWCSTFYFWRQPQTPFAFDLPQAQVPMGTHVNTLAAAYPTTIFNCGSTGMSWCANYCDRHSNIRYVECTPP